MRAPTGFMLAEDIFPEHVQEFREDVFLKSLYGYRGCNRKACLTMKRLIVSFVYISADTAGYRRLEGNRDMEVEKKMHAEKKINTEQKMSMEQFAENIRERLEQQGQFKKVSLQKVLKNNGVMRWGLLLHSAGSNIAPTIYLEPFYEVYEHGADMEEMIGKIREHGSAPCKSADMSFLREFPKVKDRLCMRLINRDANTEFLEKVPYREFLDLAVVYYVDYCHSEIGAGTIQVYNSHMEMWGVTEEDLWEAASINTPERKPGRIESMEDILAEMFAEQGKAEQERSVSEYRDDIGKRPLIMLVITNRERLYGAAAILYSGMLRQAADRADSDLFILPSSLHEGATRFAV